MRFYVPKMLVRSFSRFSVCQYVPKVQYIRLLDTFYPLVRLSVFNILIFSTFLRVLERSKNTRLVMFLTFVRMLQLIYS